jgi:hypothetical protein
LVVSEVGGAQAAAFAERHARNAAERATWAALHELELQTRDAVLEQLGDAAARFTTAERVAKTVGTANGAAVTVLPHQLQMRSLVLATKAFIPHFQKLDQHFADGPRAAIFNYVLGALVPGVPPAQLLPVAPVLPWLPGRGGPPRHLPGHRRALCCGGRR